MLEARDARGSRAAGGTESGAGAGAGHQPDAVVRAVGWRQPARRAVRRQAQQRLRKASTAARSVGRANKERGDVTHAEADVEALKEQVAAMKRVEAEIGQIEAEFDPNTIRVEKVPVRPKKSDISVEDMALVWCP